MRRGRKDENFIVEPVPSNLEAKIEEAVRIITEAKGAPMKGIQLLKEVLEEDPKNRQALYYLGNFSIQSGQFEKAKERYTSMLQNDPKDEEARYLLGYSNLMLGDTVNAISNFEQLLKNGTNAELKGLATEEINKLKNL